MVLGETTRKIFGMDYESVKGKGFQAAVEEAGKRATGSI